MVVFYSLEQHTFETAIATPPCEPCAPGEAVVCHCLQVTETTVVRAVRDQGARSLCELACLTGAGGGCTACHRRLRHYLAEGRSDERGAWSAERGAAAS
jgi:bacterioferritin-associated ferredoxin